MFDLLFVFLATNVEYLTNERTCNENGKLVESKIVQSALLCCSPMRNEEIQSAE